MYSSIFQNAIAGGSNETTTVGAGHLNGLYIGGACDLNSTVSIQLRTEFGTRVLVQDAPTALFKSIERLRNSGSRDTDNQLQNMLNGFRADLVAINAGLSSPVTLDGRYALAKKVLNARLTEGGFHIDLGSIHLSKGEELSITLRNGVGQPAKVFSILTFSNSRSPYHLIAYELRKDEQVTMHDAIESYVYVRESVTADGLGQTLLTGYPEISIKSGEFSYMANLGDILQAQAARFTGPTNLNEMLATLWFNPSPIPETIDVRATGNGSGDVEWLTISKLFIQQKVSDTNVSELATLEARIKKLEREDPEKAKALRHSNEIPKSTDVAATIRVMEKSTS